MSVRGGGSGTRDDRSPSEAASPVPRPPVTRVVQIAPHVAPGRGAEGVAYELERAFTTAGVHTERFTAETAGRRSVGHASRLRHVWDVTWFSTAGSRRAARFLAARPDAVSICHNDVMAGDIYVDHGLLQASMRARGNYVWRMLRNPLHIFTAFRDRIRYRGHVHRAVVTLSAREAELLQKEYGHITPSVTTIPNGVDLDRFRPATDAERTNSREHLGVHDDQRIAVFIGHELPRKGLPLIIDALAEAPATLLVVVGGSERDMRAMRARAARNSVADRVRFLGVRPDPVPYLHAADVFMLASAYEANALALLEALACGIPVVATDAGAARDVVVDGENGFIVERDPAEMARRLRELEHMDQASLRLAARASVEHLGWSGVAGRYLELAAAIAEQKRENAEQLRIVHAIRSDGYSGVERFVERLAIEQAARGCRVVVIGGAADSMTPSLRAAGVRHLPARTTWDVVRGLRRSRDADVVNTHMTAADLAAVAAFAGDPKKPTVVSTRHFSRRRGTIGPVRFDDLVGAVVDGEISISDAVATRIGRPSVVVHPGVEDRDPPTSAQRTKTVLIAQRLQPEKRTDLGLRVFAASGLAERGWRLEVAGSGLELGALRVLAAELQIADIVSFLGYRDDLPELMARAGVLVAPCPIEGFGLTVLESMRAGLPIVAARGGGHIELLEGTDDRSLFDPDDIAGAGDALRSLCEDETGRAALADALRARQQAAFSVGAQAAATAAVYRAVAAARQTGRRP